MMNVTTIKHKSITLSDTISKITETLSTNRVLYVPVLLLFLHISLCYGLETVGDSKSISDKPERIFLPQDYDCEFFSVYVKTHSQEYHKNEYETHHHDKSNRVVMCIKNHPKNANICGDYYAINMVSSIESILMGSTPYSMSTIPDASNLSIIEIRHMYSICYQVFSDWVTTTYNHNHGPRITKDYPKKWELLPLRNEITITTSIKDTWTNSKTIEYQLSNETKTLISQYNDYPLLRKATDLKECVKILYNMFLSSYYYSDKSSYSSTSNQDYNTDSASDKYPLGSIAIKSDTNNNNRGQCYLSLVTIESFVNTHNVQKSSNYIVPASLNNSPTNNDDQQDTELSQHVDEPPHTIDTIPLLKYYWIISTNIPWKIRLDEAIQLHQHEVHENRKYTTIYNNNKYYKLLNLNHLGSTHHSSSSSSSPFTGDYYNPLLLDPLHYYSSEILDFICSEIRTDHYRYPFLPISAFDSSDAINRNNISNTVINFVHSNIIRLPHVLRTEDVSRDNESFTSLDPHEF